MGENLKAALRGLAKAVVVVTSAYEGVRYAMSATAVSELSLDPPSMLICVNRAASIARPLSRGAPFILNILHHSQAPIARLCGGEAKGEDRFLQGEWLSTDLGIPRLADAQAAILCGNDRRIDYGSHTVVVGRVAKVFMCGVPEPLLYMNGRYTRAVGPGSLSPEWSR